MAVLTIRVGGRDYEVACDDGQEEHLRRLADEVDDRIQSLVYRMGGHPGEAMALLLAAITMADEMMESRLPPNGADAGQEPRLAEMEAAMASTLEDIAARIERIAQRVELR